MLLTPTPSGGVVKDLALVLFVVRATSPLPVLNESYAAIHAVLVGSGIFVTHCTVQFSVGKTFWSFVAVVAVVDAVLPIVLVVAAPRVWCCCTGSADGGTGVTWGSSLDAGDGTHIIKLTI